MDVCREGLEVLPPGTPYRYEFHWARPRVTRYRAAIPRRIGFHWNRYPGALIGAAIQFGPWVFGVKWGRPGKAVAAGRHRAQ